MSTETAPDGKYLKLDWRGVTDRFLIEAAMIRAGGKITVGGVEFGHGIAYHYKQAITALWPHFEWHAWSELLIRTFSEENEVGVMGPASSGKTYCSAAWSLCTFWVWHTGTSIIMSSTTREGLQLRVWGAIKSLFKKAKERRPWLHGRIIESRNMLTAAEGDGEAQDFRSGIIGVACRVGGQFVGISAYVGLKNDRVILVADEASLMERGFVDAISNLRKNPVFKAIVMGNPKDRTDPLGIVCEPHTSIGGWEGLTQEEKTTTWKTRAGGMAVQLCGFDSPNYRYPRGLNPFRGLIKPEDIEADIAYYGRDSLQFSMMNLGMMPKDGGLRRVITMSMCESHGALEEVIWSDANQLTDILALDAAYSGVGGDRCPLIHLRYGPTVSGLVKIAVVSIQNIPVKPGAEESPEDQIARYVMMMAKTLNVPPGRTGFDSTGRGTLMSSFARLWSPDVIPIEFGGLPSKTRTVRADSQQTEAEAFGKQVSALWFASRHLIEARQLGQLTREIVEDGACREWGITKTGKQDVEPKEKTKLRMGRSPDLWDSLVTGIEVARRNGFQIAAGNSVGVTKRRTPSWLKDMASRNQALDQSHSLTY